MNIEHSSGRRQSLLIALLGATVCGAVIAYQGRINGDLTSSGTGMVLAVWTSYLGTLLTIGALLAVWGKFGAAIRIYRERGRWWWVAIGVSGIPLVLAMAGGIPLIGVAIASVCGVAGQTVAGLGLDAKGIGRSQPLPLSGLRIVAGLVALGGLTVAVVGGGAVDASTWTVVGIGVALFGGGIILTIQSAGTGQVTLETGNPLIATLASSLGGFLGISVIAAIAWIGGAFDGATLPGWDEWWLYLGGPMGAVIVILTAWAVPRLGVFLLTLSVVGGQMLVSILLDVQRHGVSWFTVAAAVITCAAVGLAMPRNKVAGSA